MEITKEQLEPTESDREQTAMLTQKLSTTDVIIKRWPVDGPLLGPATIIKPIDYVAEKLADSGFMHAWVVEKIKEHLLSGGSLVNKGTTKQNYEQAIVSNGEQLYLTVRSEYKMATEQERLNYVDHEKFKQLTGHPLSKKVRNRGFVLHYHEGPALIEAYDSLPRQAKTILDILNESGRETLTEASIALLLTDAIVRLKTTQEPMKVFQFYKLRLITDGHLEEVEE